MRHVVAVSASVAIAVTALLAAPAEAMSLRELRLLSTVKRTGETSVTYYLVGTMEGLVEANRHAVSEGGKPWMCLAGRKYGPAMAHDLFHAELRRNPDLYEADMPVELVMRNALASSFGC